VTIQFDQVSSTNSGSSTNVAMTHAISAGAKNVAVFVHTTGVFSSNVAPVPVYAGNAMTLVDTQTIADAGNAGAQHVYYAVGMPSGDNTVNVMDFGFTNGTITVLGYTGVDQTSPIGTPDKEAYVPSTTTTSEVTVTSSTNGLVIDFLTVKDSVTNYTPGTGQTKRSFVASGGSGTNRTVANSSEKLGATSVAMTWSSFPNLGYGAIAVPLNPAQSLVSRGIDYFFDIYDPSGRILDANGREVMPWKLRANRWIRVSGLFLPSAVKYENYTLDPELAYIEEVSYSLRGGLRIKTNRGELTEVLLARAAGGKIL